MAARIRESDIALVRERNRIDDVVGEHISLRQSGGGALKGLCPFHEEKSPSLNIRPSHGTFHCFGCHEGGDVIAFVMKIHHLSFVEAVQRLADRVGITLTFEGAGPSVQRERGSRSRLIEAHRIAAEFYAEQLNTPEAAKAREFLTQRGFDQSAAGRFMCGFAPSGWDKLTKHLLSRGYELPELVTAQLSKQGKQGPIDRFHRRLLWPIKDLSGDVVGFGARRIFDDDRIEAKYLNTGESPIYRKSQLLFGLDQAKREIAKRRQVVVVEGYTDVMAMHLAGVPTAVASCGTAFGADHMTVLRRLLIDDDISGEVIFTFDGDAAGQKAALKAFEGEQRFSAQTYIAVAPDGMDPCELRQKHGDVALRDLVARRTPLFEFAIRTQLRDYDLDSVDGQVEALRKMAPLVANIKDRAKRDGYATKLAWWVGWERVDDVVRRVRELASAAPSRTEHAPAAGKRGRTENALAPAANDPKFLHERLAIKAALQYPELAGPDYDSLPAEVFTHPVYAAVHRAIQTAGGASAGLDGPAFINAVSKACPNPVLEALTIELSVEPLPVSRDEFPFVRGVIAGLRAAEISRQISEIESKLRRVSPVEKTDEYRALFGDLVALRDYHRGLSEIAADGL